MPHPNEWYDIFVQPYSINFPPISRKELLMAAIRTETLTDDAINFTSALAEHTRKLERELSEAHEASKRDRRELSEAREASKHNRRVVVDAEIILHRLIDGRPDLIEGLNALERDGFNRDLQEVRTSIASLLDTYSIPGGTLSLRARVQWLINEKQTLDNVRADRDALALRLQRVQNAASGK